MSKGSTVCFACKTVSVFVCLFVWFFTGICSKEKNKLNWHIGSKDERTNCVSLLIEHGARSFHILETLETVHNTS